MIINQRLDLEGKKVYYVSSCGEDFCSQELPNGKFEAFCEGDSAERDYLLDEEFDSPKQAIEEIRSRFS
jgi:hypothetical protein